MAGNSNKYIYNVSVAYGQYRKEIEIERDKSVAFVIEKMVMKQNQNQNYGRFIDTQYITKDKERNGQDERPWSV